MPRKKNGYGNFNVNDIKGVNSSFDKGKGSTSAGNYPAVRSFGSTLTRSAIEQYDLESTWSRWRRGLEYYYQGAYLDFTQTDAVLYQGTNFEVPVTFIGQRFATKNADSRTHYAIRREVDQNQQLGVIVQRYNDEYAYPEYRRNKEIWLKVDTSAGYSDDLLLRSVGERVTDGVTAANISWVLTSAKHPAVYLGKSQAEGVVAVTTVSLSDVLATEFIINNNGDIQSLVGEAVNMPDFYQNRTISALDKFTDYPHDFRVNLTETITSTTIQILDTSTGLPPTLGEINTADQIFSTTTATSTLEGDFVYEKERYQRFFGQQYLTADLVRSELTQLAYGILPWSIQSVKADVTNNELTITSEPFQSSLQLYTPSETYRYIIFPEKGFTTKTPDVDADGNYKHAPPVPGEKLWEKIYLDIDPWIDEIFSNNQPLSISEIYTCSCPAYLHAVLRNPESTDDDGKKINRQQRLPTPTAKGASTYEANGLLKTVGIAESWATDEYKKSFKVCKHTIASMFIDKVRVMEPNTFPSADAREKFEEKLAKDIQEVAEEFTAQLRRSEMTQIEVIYALAEALNLDDVEIGYVLLTSKF